MADTKGGSPLGAGNQPGPYAAVHSAGAALLQTRVAYCARRYTEPMWVWGLSAAAVVIVGGVLRALAKRRVDPGEGLSVSDAWVVEHRAAREDFDR